MASCQQYKSQTCGGSEQQKLCPVPQGQTVRVTCKAYPGKTLGIENGSVELVELEKVGVGAKFEVNDAVKVEVQFFALFNKDKDKTLAYGPASQKVSLVKYDNSVPPKSNVLWAEVSINDNNEFKPISTARNLSDEITHIYGNLDVNKSGDRTDIVLNAPNHKESQLWNISPVPFLT